MRCYKPAMHLKGSQLNFHLLQQPEHMMRLRSSFQVCAQKRTQLSPQPPHPPRPPRLLQPCGVQHCPLCQVWLTSASSLLLAVQRHLRRRQPEPDGGLRGSGDPARSGPLLRPGVAAAGPAAVHCRSLPLHVDQRGMVAGRKESPPARSRKYCRVLREKHSRLH